jgi:hypothetical protein
VPGSDLPPLLFNAVLNFLLLLISVLSELRSPQKPEKKTPPEFNYCRPMAWTVILSKNPPGAADIKGGGYFFYNNEPVPKLIDCALTRTVRTSGSTGQVLAVFQAFRLKNRKFHGFFPKTDVLGKFLNTLNYYYAAAAAITITVGLGIAGRFCLCSIEAEGGVAARPFR